MSTLKTTNLQNASAASPAFVLAADGSATANLSSVNGGPLSGMRNRIINGNYDVWQRGTSFSLSASIAYTTDRWEFGGTGTITRQAFSIGQTDVPGEPTYFAEWNITSNSQNYECVQKIEDVRNFAGGKLTVSFYAKRSSGTTNLAPRVVQYFGTGGSPSGVVTTSLGSAPALTTSWQKFVYTIDVPSIAGKTIGTDNNNSIWISLQISNTATGTIQLAQVQAEPGSTATPFERRSYGQELALCQRYFANVPVTGMGIAFSNTTWDGQFSLPVPMRAQVTATAFSVITVSNVTTSDFGQSSPNINAVISLGATSVHLRFGNFTGLTGGSAYLARNADMYTSFSAEL